MQRRFFAGVVCIPAYLRQLGSNAAGDLLRPSPAAIFSGASVEDWCDGKYKRALAKMNDWSPVVIEVYLHILVYTKYHNCVTALTKTRVQSGSVKVTTANPGFTCGVSHHSAEWCG